MPLPNLPRPIPKPRGLRESPTLGGNGHAPNHKAAFPARFVVLGLLAVGLIVSVLVLLLRSR